VVRSLAPTISSTITTDDFSRGDTLYDFIIDNGVNHTLFRSTSLRVLCSHG